MKKIISVTFILLSTFTFSVYSEDAKLPCRYKDGSLGLNTFETFDCQLSSKISSEPKLKNEFKEHVDKKIAKKLAKKSSDVIEDLALLDSYFEMNDIDLGKNTKVLESCKLDRIAAPVCPGVLPELVKKKLAYILNSDYLPKADKDNNNLYKRMVAKANDVRSGNKLKNANSCPVKGDSGDFIINSQFTNLDAKRFISDIKTGRGGTLKKLYKKYPQLSFLSSDKGDSLQKKFEDYLKKFEGDDTKSKSFIDAFFKNEDNQKEMAISVAAKCDELKDNIESFACNNNYPNLGIRESDRDGFFDDKEDEVFKEVSRGLSCEMEKDLEDGKIKDPFTLPGNIIEKFENYSKDLRIQQDDDSIKRNLEPFCSLFLCQDSKVKQIVNSCKQGGPVTSKDIISTCPGKTFDSCDDTLQKYISYLSSMERDAVNSGSASSVLASSQGGVSSDGTPQKPRGFSSFYQNFLGVEGTIAAEGKKITPITIAEKKAEFTEKKLDTNMASLSQSREREVSARPEPRQEISQMNEGMDSIDSAPITRESDDFRRTFSPQQFNKANYEIGKDASGKPKKVKFTDTDSSTLDEMKKLRGELADAIGKVKGTDEERLAAISDNNTMAIAPKGAPVTAIKSLSTGEKERLDSYRESLNNWENRLRTWQNNLSDRDMRPSSGSTSNDVRPETPVAVADQSNNAGSSANAMKLSKTTSAAGAALAKADATGDRAPGTEKADSESGVVNSENLATLEAGSLSKLGITVSDSFIIKVRHKDKIYSVPVKTFNHDGKNMFVPLLNDKDRELSKIVYDSPLFKDYRTYQKERQYKLEQQKH